MKAQDSDVLYLAEHVAFKVGLSIANAILQSFVDSQSAGHSGQQHIDEQGQRRQFKQYATKRVETIVGPITVRSAQYHSKQVEPHCVYPARERLGLLEGEYSRGMEELIALAGADAVYRNGLQLLNRLTGANVSVRKTATTVASWGQQAKAKVSARVKQPESRAERVAATLPVKGLRMCVAVDGTSVQTTKRWREVKLITSYAFDSRGEKIGQASYAGTLNYQDDFGTLLWELMERTNASRAEVLVWLGDGAQWIWNQQLIVAPHAVPIVDFYHPSGRLWDLGRALYSKPKDAKRWSKRWIKKLYKGKVDALLKVLRRHHKHLGDPPRNCAADDPRKIVRDALRYFTNNAGRMHYDEYLAKGYPIGSGVIESACRHIVGLRMKRTATMAWSEQNAEAMVQLRCLSASNNWDVFWGLDELWKQICALAA